MKKLLPLYLTFILILSFSVLNAQTCVNVTSLTGPGVDRIYRHAVSPNGITYIDYIFWDDESVSIQGHTFGPHFDPLWEGFIMKLDKDNNFQWIQRHGKNYENQLNVYSIFSDEEDNCFIYGRIYGEIVFAGHTLTTKGEEWGHFGQVVIKLDSSGNFVWASRFSGSDEMIDDGLGHLFFLTTFGVNDFIFKAPNGDTTVVKKREGIQNAIFSLNKGSGRKAFFTKLRNDIGIINDDQNQTAICNLYSVNNQAYLSAYIVEGSSKRSKIFTCSSTGHITQQKTLDGQVLSLFASPLDDSYLYCYVDLLNGMYNTRKYTKDFSTVIMQSENANAPIYSNYSNKSNFFVDNNGDITAIINPHVPNWFTYNGEKVYENNTRRYALAQFSSDLDLINFKTIIPGWDYEAYNSLYFLPDNNTFKLIGFGSIPNQIDTVSYAADGYQPDSFIFDFLNDANITYPEIILTHLVLDLDLDDSYQMNYTILDATGDEIVEWTSLDSLLVSVSSEGLVTGVGVGETTIIATITATGMADSCLVRVSEALNPEIVLSETIIDLEVEAIEQLSYTINNGNGDEIVEWFSMDSLVASVDNSGLVTALTEGQTNIIATIIQNGSADTCLVRVSPNTGLVKVLPSSIKIFPNPINDYVSFESNSLINKVEIYNIAGKKVIETRKAGKIDLSHLYHGIYFFKVYVEGGQKLTYRMIKN